MFTSLYRRSVLLTTVVILIVLRHDGVDAKKKKCKGPKSHDVSIEAGQDVYLVEIVGFTGYQVRNKANLKLKNIKSFYDCYAACAERSEGNWETLEDLDITEECGSFQYDSKKKVCTLYSALSYKDDTVPQVKICKSKKKDKHRYTAATIAYKYTATCWLPNLPSNYCYNVAAKIGSHCTMGKMPPKGKWVGFKTAYGEEDSRGDENLFNGMWGYVKRNYKQAAKMYKTVKGVYSAKECFHVCAMEKSKCKAFSYGQVKRRCLLSKAKAPDPYDEENTGQTKWCENTAYTSGYLWKQGRELLTVGGNELHIEIPLLHTRRIVTWSQSKEVADDDKEEEEEEREKVTRMTETLDVDAQKLIDADVLVESQNGQENDQDSVSHRRHKGGVNTRKRRASTRYLLSPHIESQEQSSVVREQQRVPGSDVKCDNAEILFRKLLESAFPGHLPEYLTSDEYYLFTPKEDFISLPSEAARTEFRLVAKVDGWETVVAVRELGQIVDPERRMLVTMAEFDSDPVESEDGESMVVSVVAYPSVSVKKSFLDGMILDLHRAHAALQPHTV
eukprot:jgi/Picre1/35401/NNA_002863.t1